MKSGEVHWWNHPWWNDDGGFNFIVIDLKNLASIDWSVLLSLNLILGHSESDSEWARIGKFECWSVNSNMKKSGKNPNECALNVITWLSCDLEWSSAFLKTGEHYSHIYLFREVFWKVYKYQKHSIIGNLLTSVYISIFSPDNKGFQFQTRQGSHNEIWPWVSKCGQVCKEFGSINFTDYQPEILG